MNDNKIKNSGSSVYPAPEVVKRVYSKPIITILNIICEDVFANSVSNSTIPVRQQTFDRDARAPQLRHPFGEWMDNDK